MVFGIIIVAVAVFVAYMINKSKVSEVKVEVPEKVEPKVEQAVKTVKVEKVEKTEKKPATKKHK